MKHKAICVGETVLDIILKNGVPLSANPGGSAFNSAISLGRAGVDTYFIGECGGDDTGAMIGDFLRQNGVHQDCLRHYPGYKSTVALAFLNAANDAHYVFYRDEPAEHQDFIIPEMETGDVLVFGSYFAVAPALRPQMERLLTAARASGATIYYDVNFRPSHAKDLDSLKPAIEKNIAMSDIVRASADDLQTVYGDRDAKPDCRCFIRTDGANGITLSHDGKTESYPVEPLRPVSTIGAGDSFNAGVAYGLLKAGILREGVKADIWDPIIATAKAFSRNCCLSKENYIARNFSVSLQDV